MIHKRCQLILCGPEKLYKQGIKQKYYFYNKKKNLGTNFLWIFFSMCQLLLLVPVFWFLGPGFCASPSFCPWLGILRCGNTTHQKYIPAIKDTPPGEDPPKKINTSGNICTNLFGLNIRDDSALRNKWREAAWNSLPRLLGFGL